jgi:hypothetical protein
MVAADASSPSSGNAKDSPGRGPGPTVAAARTGPISARTPILARRREGSRTALVRVPPPILNQAGPPPQFKCPRAPPIPVPGSGEIPAGSCAYPCPQVCPAGCLPPISIGTGAAFALSLSLNSQVSACPSDLTPGKTGHSTLGPFPGRSCSFLRRLQTRVGRPAHLSGRPPRSSAAWVLAESDHGFGPRFPECRSPCHSSFSDPKETHPPAS